MRRLIPKIKSSRRGQSFAELMLVVLILAMMVSGVVEFGFLLNNYLHVLDATREAARFVSTGIAFDVEDGSIIQSFYCIASIQAARVMEPVLLDPTEGDDLVISVLSVAGTSIVRFPVTSGWSLCENYSIVTTWATANGVLLPEALVNPGWASCSHHHTNLTTAQVLARMDASAPGTGVLIVEAFYNYPQALRLPVFTAVLPDPIPVYAYSIMPLSSAEPTATPDH